MLLNKIFCTLLVIISSFLSVRLKAQEIALQKVRLAQQDFLHRDSVNLVKHIKESLMMSSNHPLVLNNIISLYNASEKIGLFKNINSDWQIPDEIKRLNIGVHRRYMIDSGKVRFFVGVFGEVSESDIIEQLQIIQYPHKVIIDKNASIGKWENQVWPHGQPAFWISNDWSPQPINEGLYLINIKIKNKEMVQGWFVLSNENSSASPVVSTPKPYQVFKSGQPTFSWLNFHSPEFSNNEKTKLTFKVSNEINENYEELVSADLKYNPQVGIIKFSVGDRSLAKEYIGIDSLRPGSYQLAISYRESHQFGNLNLSRVSTTKVPFNIIF